MGKKQKKKLSPGAKREAGTACLVTNSAFETLCTGEYTRLIDSPDVTMATGYVANLVSSMTIHLMQNTPKGDKRIKNELSRKIDISPWKHGTRKSWLYNIVRNLLVYGNQVVVPISRGGYIQDLMPVPPGSVSFIENPAGGYYMRISGRVFYPDEVLHFVYNPDPDRPWEGMGIRVPLKGVANNLKQAAATKKGFMETRWKPSIIVKVDGLVDEFSGLEGRKNFLKEYLETEQAGEPWVIPAGMVDIQQVKPLTLNDLALNNSVKADKQEIAALVGVPGYVLGVGEYRQDEFNNCVSTTIRGIAEIIQQEFTKKLLVSPDLYFRLNVRSLYSYSLNEMIAAGGAMVDRMAMRRNEWRDWVGFAPDDEMEELLALENYIPADRLGDQGKLIQGGEPNGTQEPEDPL